ncbi:MAG: phosphate/phosphite/phosphonate ABC transporter substrate-binding protein [Propionibacteriaceae bacterium]|jgi:phosphonate transport system substrate-binding protein|nr:phosphate/phosphite/phosphonate ABC transporter substrate-binding protein [Propionibacteriaceae bacterium]
MSTNHRPGWAVGLTALLAAASLALSGCGSASPTDPTNPPETGYAVDSNTLVFGVVPDSVSTETNYTPLMDYIAQQTGKTVRYHESTDYAALIEAAIAGKIDVASFSGFTYVTATNQGASLIPVGSIVTKKGEEPGYYSMAIVPKDSAIQSLAEFRGLKVCFVDPSSTSGYLFPSYNLLEQGIDPETDVTPVFAGKHDISVTKTGEGRECEAGFAEDSEVAKSDAVRVVQQTQVPGAPIVVSGHLPQAMRDKLRDILQEVTIDQIIAAGVSSADSDGFRAVFYATRPVNDAYYDLIRDICAKTGAKQCQA